MKIRVIYENWKQVLPVPKDVVDKHITAASGLFFKVLLYILCDNAMACDTDQIAKTLQLDPSDVAEAVNYWIRAGYLARCEQPHETQSESQPAQDTAARTYQPVRPGSMTGQEVARLIAQNKQVQILLTGAENLFGRLLSSTEQKTFISILEYLNLPVDIILMIIGHCVSIDKASARYIEKTAVNWCDLGINTHKKASEHLKMLTQQHDRYNQIKRCFGIHDRNLTAKEKKFIDTWMGEYALEIDLIRSAYEITVNNLGKLSFAYANSILEQWHDKGVKTLSQAQELTPKNKPSPNKKKNPSYDIAQFDKMGIDDIPTL